MNAERNNWPPERFQPLHLYSIPQHDNADYVVKYLADGMSVNIGEASPGEKFQIYFGIASDSPIIGDKGWTSIVADSAFAGILQRINSN